MRKMLFGKKNGKEFSKDFGILVLRLTFGLGIALGHGLGKFPPSDKFIEGVSSLGFLLPELFAWSASLSELFGGILLALGLFTRPAAFFLATTMGVAFFVRHGLDPFKVKELAYLYLAASVSLFFLGSGKFSLDNLFRK
jgi:putative oxidoreductase